MSDERFKKVAEYPGFVKDEVTKTILNTDNAGLQAYKRQKATFRQAADNAQRLDKLESEMSEIKDLLKIIAGKL